MISGRRSDSQQKREKNEMQKILRDFEIQTDPLISPRRPDQEIVKKKKLPNSGLCRSGWPPDKTEKKKKNEKRDK